MVAQTGRHKGIRWLAALFLLCGGLLLPASGDAQLQRKVRIMVVNNSSYGIYHMYAWVHTDASHGGDLLRGRNLAPGQRMPVLMPADADMDLEFGDELSHTCIEEHVRAVGNGSYVITNRKVDQICHWH